MQGEIDKFTEWEILTTLSQKSDNQVHTQKGDREDLKYTIKQLCFNDTHRILYPTKMEYNYF